MVDITLGVKTTSKLNDIANALRKKARRRLKTNVKEIRQIVANAINTTVHRNRNLFIPTDQEAHELGIGEDGEIDTDRTNGAWLELLTTGEATQFSVEEIPGESFGLIQVVISEELLFSLPLSNIPVDPSKDEDAEQINNIPWMRWLIEGAPANPNYGFDSSNRGIASRTGGGIMVFGGVWSFPPARPNAFATLISEIEKKIRRDVKRNIGRIV